MSFPSGLLPGDEIVRLRTSPKEPPIVVGHKQYCPDNSWLEQKQIRVCLENKKNIIGAERLEKIQNLSKAEWVNELNKARVTRKVGRHWDIFGHSQGNEVWLLAEEALYLLETCCLELTLNGVPLSVEQCYALLFGGTASCSLDEYRVYSHLLKRGFRVVRHDDTVRVTRYEKEVVLDQVVTRQKRSLPVDNSEAHASSKRSNVDDVLVVNDETVKNLGSDVVFLGETSSVCSDVIVLNESDSEEEKPVQTKNELIRNSDDLGRNWYCSFREWIYGQDEIEEIRDCSVPGKYAFCDIGRKPIRHILRSLPNANCGTTLITSPDQRLIPSSIRPRHYQYRVKLMTSNTTVPNTETQIENSVVHDLTNDDVVVPTNSSVVAPLNRPVVNSQFITNSILTQAHSIQVMAMGMVRSSLQMLTSFQGQRLNFNNYSFPRFQFNGHNPRMNYGCAPKRPWWWRGRHFNRRGGARRGRPWSRQNNVNVKPRAKCDVVVVDDDDDNAAADTDSDPEAVVEVPPPEKKQKIQIVDLDSPPDSPDVEEIVDVTKENVVFTGEPSTSKISEPENSAAVVVEDDEMTSTTSIQDREDSNREVREGDENSEGNGRAVTDCESMDLETNESSSNNDPSFGDTDNSQGSGQPLDTWEQFKQTQEFSENIGRAEVPPLYNAASCSSLDNLLKRLQIFSPIAYNPAGSVADRLKISFDLYPPNEHFKKSLKQLPKYRVLVMRAPEEMPSFQEMSFLKTKFEDSIPLLFAIVLEDGLSFFIYDFVDLPVLNNV